MNEDPEDLKPYPRKTKRDNWGPLVFLHSVNLTNFKSTRLRYLFSNEAIACLNGRCIDLQFFLFGNTFDFIVDFVKKPAISLAEK